MSTTQKVLSGFQVAFFGLFMLFCGWLVLFQLWHFLIPPWASAEVFGEDLAKAGIGWVAFLGVRYCWKKLRPAKIPDRPNDPTITTPAAIEIRDNAANESKNLSGIAASGFVLGMLLSVGLILSAGWYFETPPQSTGRGAVFGLLMAAGLGGTRYCWKRLRSAKTPKVAVEI